MVQLRIALWLLCSISFYFGSIDPAQARTKKKPWIYSIVSIEGLSSDDNQFKSDMHVEQIARGVFGLTGNIIVQLRDDMIVEARTFRSSSSNLKFNLLPFSLPKQSVHSIINGAYKTYLMDGIKNCSTMPQFKDEYKIPTEIQNYRFNSCQLSQDKMPHYLEPGFYKVEVNGYGEVIWNLSTIFKVELA